MRKARNVTKKKLVTMYIMDQALFYTKCLTYLNASGRTWTIIIDVDEYLTFNPVTDYDSNYVKRDKSDPNSSYKYLDTPIKNGNISAEKKLKLHRMKSLMEARVRVPRGFMSNNITTIADFIKEEEDKLPWTDPCVVFPRLQFSDREFTNESAFSTLWRGMPNGFQPSNYTTLKHFTHGKKGSYRDNRNGKSIVDVSRMPSFKVQNPHSIRRATVSI